MLCGVERCLSFTFFLLLKVYIASCIFRRQCHMSVACNTLINEVMVATLLITWSIRVALVSYIIVI